jgi:hypothetical protein
MRKVLIVVALMGLTAPVAIVGQALRGTTAAGWQAYVAATEARVARDAGQAVPRNAEVGRGQVLIERVQMAGPSGELEVPDATVNHWRGFVLVPGAQLEDMVSRLEREPPDTRQEDVLTSAILERRPGWLRVSVRVHRALILSAVFDTEHEVTFQRHSASRASSRSTATRIVEIAGAGTPREREKRPDEDRGLLWRWNAYWRYEQVEGGVLVECESVTLSRPVPMLLRPVAGPLVSHVAKESMDRTLVTFRDRFRVPSS